MKKIIVIVIIFSFMSNYINAQESGNKRDSRDDFRDRFMFGLKIGANYSNLFDEQSDAFSADPKFGLATGAFFMIPIGKIFGVEPEILYSQKGFIAKGNTLTNRINYEFRRKTNYIDVPILFAFKPSSYFSLLAGPEYSYLLKQTDVYTSASSSVQYETDFKNDNLRRNIFGFVIGADINVNHFVVSARIGWDIQKNNGDGTSTIPRYKNVYYQGTLGYRFYN